MPLTTFLYCPANRRGLFEKALAAKPDAVIFDLEDAVPLTGKAAARENLREFFPSLGAECRPEILIRLNTDLAAIEDIRDTWSEHISGVIVSKCEDAKHVQMIDHELSLLERTYDAKRRPSFIIPLIETVRGLFSLGQLSGASKRVIRFGFGAADFVRDLGGVSTADRSETLMARATIVAQSVLLGLEPPVAHVVTPIDDLERLERASIEDRALGFGGRSCIHPSQLDIVGRVFGVSHDEIAKAELILAANQRAQAEGRGAFVMQDGTFVDEAIVRTAQNLLEHARTGQPQSADPCGCIASDS